GTFESPAIKPILSALEIEDLGIAHKGDRVHEKAYLVADASVEIKIEEIHRRKGGIRYSVGLEKNPEAFGFEPGGLFQSRCLISGSIGTATGNPTSIALCRAFIRAIRKDFTKIKSYWLGPEALQFLDAGMRLTPSVNAAPMLDFQR